MTDKKQFEIEKQGTSWTLFNPDGLGVGILWREDDAIRAMDVHNACTGIDNPAAAMEKVREALRQYADKEDWGDIPHPDAPGCYLFEPPEGAHGADIAIEALPALGEGEKEE
jgi:hypothetical protein